MLTTEDLLRAPVAAAVAELFSADIQPGSVTFQRTNPAFEGDVTLVVFPYVKLAGKGPEQTAQLIGEHLQAKLPEVARFNVVKGFLNLVIADDFWNRQFTTLSSEPAYGHKPVTNTSPMVMVEYSSPNTNKPLHLGHVRNNLLGFSVSEILKAAGYRVVMVNLVNDRGIHICKSMYAWQQLGNGETPESSGIKGDHLVGKYYVEFDKLYKEQVKLAVAAGQTEEEAGKTVPAMLAIQEMLRKWEAGDEEVIALWKMMNGWVYDGFNTTYKKLGVSFDKIYYESNTYLLGKSIVEDGLNKGVLLKRPDGAVIIDLTPDGLDQKVLLRSDGTSVYMTQDLGTAAERHNEFPFEKLVYVVGNEQEYHFKVLKLALAKLGYAWADGLYHLSYGMVELPHGKMKSREGTVVDADDLIQLMEDDAQKLAEDRGLIADMSSEAKATLYHQVGMAALKYFILKVDPRKKMLFNPEESIDLQGNTGPFIQYTYARIRSMLRKAGVADSLPGFTTPAQLHEKEKALIKHLHQYPAIVQEAAATYNPAVVAQYTYDLAKTYNQFYDACPVMKAESDTLKHFRLNLSACVARTVKESLRLLGIEAPEQM
ncbi:MAG: arginine--tRNA ligase [Bacteroidia bacterium]|jgi:arginyl-tRNA synthetase|nr:arginine--tRNA ligase [Bacteroidia bacterium]